MAELTIADQSSMSARTSLVPFKSTSAQITGLLPTSPNLAKHADLALPDQGTAHTKRADDEIQLSASREIAQIRECSNLHDINIMGGANDRIKEDKSVINGQLESISLPRNAQEVTTSKHRPLKKLQWEGGSYNPQEGEVEEEGGECACVTPTAREQRIPQEILRCPPPPCKKRNRKRKSDAMADPALQLVVRPPDLHTFPECIRALFSPN